MKSIFNSLYFTWLILALPSIGMLIAISNGADPAKFLHPTGEFSARFMIIAMMISPLLLLLLGIWTGWFAFAIFVPVALTSNQTMVRRLKARWKPLQRWVYPAAVLTLVHWIFVENNIGPALVHFIPLAALEIYRVYKISTKPSS